MCKLDLILKISFLNISKHQFLNAVNIQYSISKTNKYSNIVSKICMIIQYTYLGVTISLYSNLTTLVADAMLYGMTMLSMS